MTNENDNRCPESRGNDHDEHDAHCPEQLARAGL